MLFRSRAQPSFDKQYIRDWLESSGWNKSPPPPKLSEEVIEKTSKRYIEAFERITNLSLNSDEF